MHRNTSCNKENELLDVSKQELTELERTIYKSPSQSHEIISDLNWVCIFLSLVSNNTLQTPINAAKKERWTTSTWFWSAPFVGMHWWSMWSYLRLMHKESYETKRLVFTKKKANWLMHRGLQSLMQLMLLRMTELFKRGQLNTTSCLIISKLICMWFILLLSRGMVLSWNVLQFIKLR